MILKKFLLSVCFTAVLLTPVLPQVLKSDRHVAGVSYAGTRVNRMYLPPPKEFFIKRDAKGGAEITVTYSNFPVTVKKAIDYAVSIMETLLPEDTRISVSATWKRITQRGVLGNSSISGLVAGDAINAPDPHSAYPLPLAERIFGEGLNSDFAPDIEVEINSTVNWYFGTDGNTPVNQYDLVTVFLHELCHGLGFFDSMGVTDDETTGYYGFGSYPMIYDTFVENSPGKRLTDTLAFENYSSALYSAITGKQLFFNGPLVSTYLTGGRARLYAPESWDSGSSVSHFDEEATLPVNSLMTPYIDLGEAIHDPGKLIMSVLGDLGWINTRITHIAPVDTEEAVTGINISATVSSDTVFNRDLVRVVYSTDGFASSSTLPMTAANELSSVFSTMVPVNDYNVKLEYYIYTEDCFSRIFRMPSSAPEDFFSIFIGTDTVKPVITHSPASYYFNMIDSITFNATVTDNIGVDTVYAEYCINEGEWRSFGLRPEDGDVYRAAHSVAGDDFNEGDSLRYRIIALDKAQIPNIRISPAEGYYSVSIETTREPVDRYSTDFSDAEGEYYSEGLSTGAIDGFPDEALHSEHPYTSPGENGSYFDFLAVLRTPVKYDPSGLLVAYEEIVMVEPGETGALFGTEDFYDYVVIEASSDYGKTWFPVADGYDSRYRSEWLNAYNSKIDDSGNSTFVPSLSLIKEHVISADLTGLVDPGTPLLIRFRLHSDPLSNGWGWMIDNLAINSIAETTEKLYEDSLSFYPNPGDGIINLKIPQSWGAEEVDYIVYNASGTVVAMEKNADPTGPVVDISGLSQGIYYIRIMSGTRMAILKYTLVK